MGLIQAFSRTNRLLGEKEIAKAILFVSEILNRQPMMPLRYFQ